MMPAARSRTITLFEYQPVSYEALGIPSSDPLFERLDLLNQEAGAELIQLGRKRIRARRYVGVIRIGRVTFQILPKIDYEQMGDSDAPVNSNPHNCAAESATQNLLSLLSYTNQFKIRKQDIASLAGHRGNWFEMLTRLLAMDLHRLMLQGLYRKYVTVEDMLPVVRGRWNIARQLAQQPHVKHKFDLRFDEFSPDNPLNQIFRYVVDLLQAQSVDYQNRSLLTDIQGWLQPVQKVGQITQGHLEQVYFTRLNERFQPAFNLARLFVENRVIQLSAGSLSTFAFVFNMERLFEKFVEGFISRFRARILPESWHQTRIIPQVRGQRIYLAKSIPDEKKVIHLRPDLLFKNLSGKILLILDTKYKRLDRSRDQMGIAEGDMYQMLAYASRLNCDQTLVVYPQPAKSQQIRIHYQLIGQPASFFLASINLHQPLQTPDPMIQEFKELFQRVSSTTY